MFARNVALHLKANALGEFTKVRCSTELPNCRLQM